MNLSVIKKLAMKSKKIKKIFEKITSLKKAGLFFTYIGEQIEGKNNDYSDFNIFHKMFRYLLLDKEVCLTNKILFGRYDKSSRFKNSLDM